MLATGWRVSELNACTRDPNYCKIINGKLWITPNPLFLAKNETPDKRRPPKIIEPLLMEDGKLGCLCPVEAFKQYFKKSSKFKAGNLSIHPNSSQSLQVTQLGNLICKLIKKANPGLEATVHELRKFAASYALQEIMDTEELAKAMDWSSAKIFFRNYLCNIAPLSQSVTLPSSNRMKTIPSPQSPSTSSRVPSKGRRRKP